MSPKAKDIGAGASAESEYQRRRSARQSRARARFGSLGALLARLLAEPQTTQAWRQGAVAERYVAAELQRLLRDDVVSCCCTTGSFPAAETSTT